jgi:hypothetical protein
MISMAAIMLFLAQMSSPTVVAAAAPSAAPSNVCVTQVGTCPVTPGTTRGAPCQCMAPSGTTVPGIAEYWVDVPSEIP